MKALLPLHRLMDVEPGSYIILEQEPDENIAPGQYLAVAADQILTVEIDLEMSRAAGVKAADDIRKIMERIPPDGIED